MTDDEPLGGRSLEGPKSDPPEIPTYVSSDEQPSWAVFRDDGRYLGDVETPIGAQVTHIGDDFVLVIWEDELEVQQVQMHELIQAACRGPGHSMTVLPGGIPHDR